MKSVLIVDDDPQVRQLLERYLDEEGFEVFGVDSGKAMRESLSEHDIDIIILDVRLPDEDGFSLLRELRKTSSTPVLMLSGRSEITDRVAGLEAGADDYLPKPFEPRELLARIRAILRRETRAPVAWDEDAPPTLRFADYCLNLASRQLFDSVGNEITLTAMEFDILATLVLHPQRALDRDYLLDAAVGETTAALERTIDVHIGRLRKKIEADSSNPSLIKTIRGSGYILSADVQRED